MTTVAIVNVVALALIATTLLVALVCLLSVLRELRRLADSIVATEARVELLEDDASFLRDVGKLRRAL